LVYQLWQMFIQDESARMSTLQLAEGSGTPKSLEEEDKNR